MAKKHNKGRKQKPNYSKKNRDSLSNVETASELEPEIKEVDKKNPKQKIFSEEE
ncbi:MAG: hypothetical protein GX989_08095 [Firmicutes bacterium]|jgi:hypothetical protein|nr:hypothetical protein [Bacillota bacterium]